MAHPRALTVRSASLFAISLWATAAGAAPASEAEGTAQVASGDAAPSGSRAPSVPTAKSTLAELRASRALPPVAFGLLVNPVGAVFSSLINGVTVVSPMILFGDGRVACLLVPQAYASLEDKVGGVGAQVGFRIFSRGRYDGLYFGVRFGGGVGNSSFKAFMGEIDAGWMWALGAFRLGLGVNAGGGYFAYEGTQGSLYLFSLDLSLGFAFGRFG